MANRKDPSVRGPRGLLIRCCALLLAGFATAPTPVRAQGGEYWPGDSWRTSTPEAQGMDAKTLDTIDERVRKDFPYMSSVLVVRNGAIVFEKYYQGGREDLREQFSITKTAMSALTGIAIGQRLVESVEAEVYSYLPDSVRSGMSSAARSVTVRQLLTHTSGLADNGGLGVIEPTALRRSVQSLAHAPGTAFAYNGDNANLLSVVISQASGRRASEFARAYLLDPIGIRQARWEEGSQWTAGCTGLAVTTRDMARLGYLYLRKGRWNDVQVLSPDWVDESTRKQVPIPPYYQTPGIDDAHGYLWWTMWYGEHRYRACAAIGYNGQRICVIPELDLVIVFTGTGGGFDVEHLPIIRDCILASMRLK